MGAGAYTPICDNCVKGWENQPNRTHICKDIFLKSGMTSCPLIRSIHQPWETCGPFLLGNFGPGFPNHQNSTNVTPPRLKKHPNIPGSKRHVGFGKLSFGFGNAIFGRFFLDAKGYPPENLHGMAGKPHQFERECSSLLKMGILQCHVSFQTCICVKTSHKMGSGLVWGIFVPPKIDLYIWASALSFEHVNHFPFRKLRCALKHRLGGGFKDF